MQVRCDKSPVVKMLIAQAYRVKIWYFLLYCPPLHLHQQPKHKDSKHQSQTNKMPNWSCRNRHASAPFFHSLVKATYANDITPIFWNIQSLLCWATYLGDRFDQMNDQKYRIRFCSSTIQVLFHQKKKEKNRSRKRKRLICCSKQFPLRMAECRYQTHPLYKLTCMLLRERIKAHTAPFWSLAGPVFTEHVDDPMTLKTLSKSSQRGMKCFRVSSHVRSKQTSTECDYWILVKMKIKTAF